MTSIPDRTERWVEARSGPLRRPVVLAYRTVHDAFDDRVPGLAAEMAFYLILSLPPLLVTVLATVGVLGRRIVADFEARTLERVQEVAATFLTDGANADLTAMLERVLEQTDGSVLSIGFLLTVVTASRAFRVTSVGITIAYDLEDHRAGWKQFAYGVGLTLGAVVVGVIVVPLFVAGPDFGEVIGSWFGLRGTFGPVYRVAYWPTAAVLATALIAVLYHVAAPWWTPWRRDLPGAVLAMVIALGGSIGLRYYASQAIASDRIFQPIAAAVVLLLWLYVMAFAVLVGAELNAEIERYEDPDRPDQDTPNPGRADGTGARTADGRTGASETTPVP